MRWFELVINRLTRYMDEQDLIKPHTINFKADLIGSSQPFSETVLVPINS